MAAIDEAVGMIVDSLDSMDLLDETIIVLTSDNGYALGTHRIKAGKKFPYNDIYNVPLCRVATVVHPGGRHAGGAGGIVHHVELRDADHHGRAR